MDKELGNFDECDCLAADPFEGDFGNSNDRTLKDKIVTARRSGKCHCCGQQITPGTRIRSRADIFDGTLFSFRWCTECCVAMAKSWEDGGESWEGRYALRRLHDGER